MLLLIIGLVLFLGVHSISIVAPRRRDAWAAAMGVNAWRGIYSLLSLAGFVLLVIGYAEARRHPVPLYFPPVWLRHVTFALMLPVFPLIFAAYLPGRIRQALKHPMLVAVKTWAVAHLLANGMLADVLLFGGFLVWAVFDRISVGRRPPRPMMMPLPAPSLRNDIIAVVLGLALYLATVLWLHRLLIGMPLA
ncbi:MAG: NnrU family protein [Pseudomonadota bacterium]|jgi:uncharacterized membrane protein|nr:MAG: NnrU family protein [Pseudomonadota bacterium]